MSRYVPGLFLGLLVIGGQGAIATATTLSSSLQNPSEDHGNTTAPLTLFAPDSLFLSQAAASIQRGDRGGQVEALQKRLADLGYYSGPVTGFFGEMTEAAVLRFQQNQGLTADGIVGSGTTAALRQAGSSPAQRANNPLTLEVGDQGPTVATLQNQLTQLGYYDGPVTGYFGSLTEAALIKFQTAQGLTPDGIVGSATQTAIDQTLGRTSSTATTDTPDPNDGVWEAGEMGAMVTTIQRQLQVLGYYNAPIDGDFGSSTEAAVREFQRSRSLTVDGKVGPQTMNALNAVTQSPTTAESSNAAPNNPRISNLPPTAIPTITVPPAPASSVTASTVSNLPPLGNDNILAIQHRLRDQGFYNGALDGQMGPDTQRAIQEAQQNHGLQTSDFGR